MRDDLQLGDNEYTQPHLTNIYDEKWFKKSNLFIGKMCEPLHLPTSVLLFTGNNFNHNLPVDSN